MVVVKSYDENLYTLPICTIEFIEMRVKDSLSNLIIDLNYEDEDVEEIPNIDWRSANPSIEEDLSNLNDSHNQGNTDNEYEYVNEAILLDIEHAKAPTIISNLEEFP